MPIDYKKYPPNWKSEIVPFVRERSNGTCECCGLRNRQRVYSVKMKIQDIDGRYKVKSIWFQKLNDAERECRIGEPKEVKVILTVAHLDHDETNFEVKMDRLMDMCQLCHLRYDAKEKYKRSLKK